MMCAWLVLFCPSHSFRVLSGDGLVGGNPTMNTPRLRRGGGIAIFKFKFTCSGTPIQYILFVTQLPSRSDGFYFLFGFSCPNLLFVFMNLIF